MELKPNQTPNGDSDVDAAAGTPGAAATTTPSETAGLAGTIRAFPAGAVELQPVNGVIQLPAGTRLDAIRISGPDLVISLPDGQVFVVADGALHPPRIILGTISISAANIAALIAGQEPEPAAGAPQSSGGNFIEAPGDIGDPFGLGDLLPPTDFGFANSANEDDILAAIDNDPKITIVTQDQPLGSTSATATVSEAALAARGVEPAGSDFPSNADSVTGVIQINSLDQPNVVAVNGTAITAVGQTVATSLGVITITSIAPDTIGYSYTLLDNSTTPDASEIIAITVTDGDGDVATATLTLVITDDVPTARADTENVGPNLYVAQVGNVITGIGTASGGAGADTLGADDATVTGVRGSSAPSFTAPGTVVQGLYGTLLLLPGGSYSYVRSLGTPGDVADVFTYELTDGDGDTSTATLTFNIADSPVGLVVPSAGDEGTVVDEAGLSERDGKSAGSRDGDDSNLTFGVINFDAGDGPAIITVNGTTLTGDGQQIELPTGTFFILAVNRDSIEYAFVLNDNVAAEAANQPITVTVADQDGDSASASFVIDILDDSPLAKADNSNASEGQTLVVNASAGLLANDVAGADGATIVGIRALGGDPSGHVVGGVSLMVAGLHGRLTVAADGGYTYVSDPGAVPPAGAEDIFVYSLQDGDGDKSTATLTITLSDSGLSASSLALSVEEAALLFGSDPDSDVESVSGDLNDNVAGGTGPFEFSLVGDGVGIHGTFEISSDGTYTYTLASPAGGPPANNGYNIVPVVETFTYTATDGLGNKSQNTVVINVVDDVPTARAAPAITIAEDAPAISGNLLGNDTQGADGATVTSVIVGGVTFAVMPSGTTTYTNAVGTYTFQAGGAYTFDPGSSSVTNPLVADFTYTITDGDGDTSTAQQQIRVVDGPNPRAGTPINLTLDDQNLENGSTPSMHQPVTVQGDIQFTAGSDPIVSIVFGDVSGLGGGLTWVRESDTQIVGFDADKPVVILDLNLVGATATVVATLESNYAFHSDVDADDLAELGSVDVVATDSEGDQAAGTVNVSVSDDVPALSTNSPAAGLLTVDETNLAVNATADFNGLFNVVLGADQPGTITHTFTVGHGSGLVDVATGSSITLHAIGNVVEGRVAGSPGVVAFRLTVAPTGQAILDQIRAVRHADATNPDDTGSAPAPIILLTATVTDADGDQVRATVNVGAALAFRDDGPSLDVAGVDTNSVVLATRDGNTRGAAFDISTADMSSDFAVVTANYGADGPNGTVVSWTYTLALGMGAAASGLTSNGMPITLALVSGDIVGSAGGTPIFSVSVNTATGVVTLRQFTEIDHALPGSGSDYANQILELPANLIELRGTATIIDRDGDSTSDSAVVDLGGNIRFADDGPSVFSGGEQPVLVLDESFLATDASTDVSGLFASTLDFGADGAGVVAYQLGVKTGPSGLIDSLTGEAVTLSIIDGLVYGRTAAHEVFRISVATNGIVTFDQSRAIIHNPESGPDQTRFLAGANLITLTATVIDGDGDSASSTTDITSAFGIKDDAPIAANGADNVSRDGQSFADGNVLTGIGGVDDNGTDGSAANAGADGGLLVSAIAFGATTGALGSALAGNYGSLILSADGAYRYDLDVTDPAVSALNANEMITDTFTYTIADADGDTSTATITITITGASDFPIARADTNWVVDGASGSDPSAVGNVLQNGNHPGAPVGSFADVVDNDPDLEPITVTSAGTYTGLYGTLVLATNGAYTYTLNEDNAAVNALDTGQTLVESFGYTISDGLFLASSILSITVFGTNDAPTIGTVTARISEEGLPGGVADLAPDGMLDATDSATFGGTLAIGDVDAGEMLTATLGDPGAVLTAGGATVTWAGVGTGTLIGLAGGNEVVRVTLAANGAYTVSLSRAVDHPIIALEDLKEFTVPVSVFDGAVTTTNASAIRIIIEDDAPTAIGETGSSAQAQQDVNTLFILDFSESIDDRELDTMLDAVKNALTLLDASALSALTIKFVIFSSLSFASGSFTTAAEANAYLDALNPSQGGTRPDTIGGNTNYSSAINTALANFSAMPGASNQVFFLSDGNPNQGVQFSPPIPPVPPTVIHSLTNATASAWNNFIDNGNVTVTAIGIDNDPSGPLQVQRLRDVDLNDAPDNEPIVVADFDDLVATLLSVVVPASVSGNLDANDAFGADGGRLLSITVGTTTYTWDGAASIAVSSGGTVSGNMLTATTPEGGTLQFNFATGHYIYQPPSPITTTSTEVFNYTITDKDGDTATAALSVTITALVPPVVLDLDGDGVEFVSSATGVHFDYDGDGRAESTAWVAPDDGLLVLDKNSDGKVNDGSEIIFGHGGLTDLQGLAADYDSNGDGRLDSADAAFLKFGVWKDTNSNGVTDAGEFMPLSQAGIASISLVSDGRSYTAANGEVVVRGEGIFTHTNGSTGKLADAAFATNFAGDPKRAVSTHEFNGLATALVVAGLVAASPMAAEDGSQPPSENPLLANNSADAVGQMIEPSPVGQADGLKFWSNQESEDAGTSTSDEPTSSRPFDDSDVSFIADPDLVVAAELPEQNVTAHQKPDVLSQQSSEPTGDQVLLPTVANLENAGLTENEVKEVVADAIEGRTIDLDAVLAAYVGSEQTHPPTILQNGLPDVFSADHALPASGELLLSNIADQHVAAQMEQAATYGYA